MSVFILFFFFQAEDGIRDKLVTGVQTCALPIWCERFAADVLMPIKDVETTLRQHGWRPGSPITNLSIAGRIASLYKVSLRSEERRVGKECRSRWSPYH